MQQVIICILVVLIFFIITMFYNKRVTIKKLRTMFIKTFGGKPKRKSSDMDEVSCYWKETREEISKDEVIDDITWNDLDMNQVYHRLNCCNSFVGEQTLYHTLHQLPKNQKRSEILEHKMKFFTEHEDDRVGLQLLLYSLGKKSVSYYLPTFLKNLDVARIQGIWIFRLLKLLLVLSVFPSIIYQNKTYLFIPGAILLINLFIYTIQKLKYEMHLESLYTILGLINIGNRIADNKNYSDEIVFGDIKKLAKLFKSISYKLGDFTLKKKKAVSGDLLFAAIEFLEGAVFFDLFKFHKIIELLADKKDEFIELYRAIGEIDMAISIASFRASLPHYSIPIFQQEKKLEMTELYHPLIDEPICNSVTFDKNCIITGSNASGKSTFVKAVTINIILAHSIHTCMAKHFHLPYAKVITSMAVRDDIMAGESYFIKEIKYLKRIIDNLSEDRFIICCIDEILRGTNTEERIAASTAILNYLRKKNCMAIVASHDIPLAKCMDGEYVNYHFCEQISTQDIIFDYKIHEGISRTKNAIKLLEFISFPQEIIEDAKIIVSV